MAAPHRFALRFAPARRCSSADRLSAEHFSANRTGVGSPPGASLLLVIALSAALGTGALACAGASSPPTSPPENGQGSMEAPGAPGERDSPCAAPSEQAGTEGGDRSGVGAGHRGAAQLERPPVEEDDEPACMMGLDCNDHPLAGCDGEDFAVRYRARCVEGSCLYTEQRERCMEGTRCMETFAGARCVPHRAADEGGEEVPARAAIDFSTRQLLINTSIRFDVASARIRSSADAILDEVAGVLLDTPDIVIRIEGHTDDTGPADGNLRLSLERAEAVRDALEARGVAATRMQVRGLGQDVPLVPNEGDWQREVNRRVEFHLVEDGGE